MKLYFFLKDSGDIIAPCNGIRVTRNTRKRRQSGNRENFLTWNLQEVMTKTELETLQKVDQMNIVSLPNYVESDMEPKGIKGNGIWIKE